MPIDDNPIKGRGSSLQVPNRFLRRAYGVVHAEGVDEVEQEAYPTRFIATEAKSILNKITSPDLSFPWTLNAYQGCEHGCSYCYARPTHEYWGYSAGLDFERVVLVKRNAPELLEKALRHPRWKGEPISMSGVTDPYQPRERVEQLTHRLLAIALEYKQPVTLITKNALILRDLDLLKALAEQRLVQVAISFTTMNEPLRRVLEPRTSSGAERLRTMERLALAKVPVMAMIAPIIPALNEPEIPDLLERAANAGALGASYTVLRTNGAVQPIFEAWLQHHFPDRAEKIMAQTRALHGGKPNDSVHGRRMRGAGAFAENISRLFRVLRKRHFVDRRMPPLNSSAFKPPARGQLDLFQ
ncbi:MAG TPA: PA0069 family radical SAM protein [Flavobacteriales bacterium]|nr:PA0069 family radical SAM protein [Flavobacteriales bacterium]